MTSVLGSEFGAPNVAPNKGMIDVRKPIGTSILRLRQQRPEVFKI